MRSLFLTVPASLLLLVSGAGTQAQDYPLNEPEPASQVQVRAPARPFQFWEYDAEAIKGAYALSNGWRMKVDSSAEGIVARIDRQPPMRLVGVAPDRFVTRDGNVRMDFNRGERGDDMVMSYVPDTRTAQVVVVTATLAQR